MTTPPIEFIHTLRYEDLPSTTVHMAWRSLMDTLGVAASGIRTDMSRIIRDHAADQFGPGTHSARMILDGRRVSAAGAALAGGITIDAIDAHDGFAPAKGHAGAGLIPSLLALSDVLGDMEAAEFMTNLVIGYELACRVSIAQHGTVPDYHTSGSWVAVAIAGMGARLLGLTPEQTRHALGIAEYHGPRSQMIRGVDFPTMVKDGSGWGAMAGVSAVYLAKTGFTGAPAATIEFDNVREYWSDLGEVWLMEQQYIKPQPVCRWAQPPAQAAIDLQQAHKIAARDITRIEVTTFNEATHLATWKPTNTEEAQYSLPFPVAAALVRGKIGFDEVCGDALTDPEILRLAEATSMMESDAYNAQFPHRRIADVELFLSDGSSVKSDPTEAKGSPEDPIDDDALIAKFHTFSEPTLTPAGAEKLLGLTQDVASGQGNCRALLDFLGQDVTTNLN